MHHDISYNIRVSVRICKYCYDIFYTYITLPHTAVFDDDDDDDDDIIMIIKIRNGHQDSNTTKMMFKHSS